MGRTRRAIALVGLLGGASFGVQCDPVCSFTTAIKVTDTSGQPVKGATVSELNGCCGADDCTRRTNTDGVASFDDVGSIASYESCRIMVEKQGFNTVVKSYGFECAKGQDVSTNVEVMLAPAQ